MDNLIVFDMIETLLSNYSEEESLATRSFKNKVESTYHGFLAKLWGSLPFRWGASPQRTHVLAKMACQPLHRKIIELSLLVSTEHNIKGFLLESTPATATLSFRNSAENDRSFPLEPVVAQEAIATLLRMAKMPMSSTETSIQGRFETVVESGVHPFRLLLSKCEDKMVMEVCTECSVPPPTDKSSTREE